MPLIKHSIVQKSYSNLICANLGVVLFALVSSMEGLPLPLSSVRDIAKVYVCYHGRYTSLQKQDRCGGVRKNVFVIIVNMLYGRNKIPPLHDNARAVLILLRG